MDPASQQLHGNALRKVQSAPDHPDLLLEESERFLPVARPPWL